MRILRRYIIITIILLLFLGLAYGVYANSNRVGIQGGLAEDLLPESKKIIKTNISNKSFIINDKEIELEYEYSVNSDKINIYKDKNNTEYILDDNKIVGFIKDYKNMLKSNNLIMNSTEKISEGEILNIAIEYCSKNVEEFKKYELTNISYIESYNEYGVTFMNKYNGYKTQDTVEINITPYGEIVSFYANNQGILEKYKNQEVNINEMELNKFIEKQLKSKYNNIASYEIDDKILGLVDDKLAVQCYITIKLDNEMFCSEIIIGYI